MHAGENIRALRAREHLTQGELANMLSVSKETVCRWETGKSAPRGKSMKRLLDLFGLSHDDIYGIDNGLAVQSNLYGKCAETNAALEEVPYTFPIRTLQPSARKTEANTLYAWAPANVAIRHPHSVFIRVSSSDLSKLYPVGSLVLIDPEVKPWNGCVVLALIDKKTAMLSRYIYGNDMVILSTYSYEAAREDIIFDKRRIHIIGVAVWYQADHDVGSA